MKFFEVAAVVATCLHGVAAVGCFTTVNDTTHRPQFFLQVLSDNFYGLNPEFDGRALQFVDDGTNNGTYIAAVTPDLSPSLGVTLRNGTLYQIFAGSESTTPFQGPYASLRRPYPVPRIEGTVYQVAFSNSTRPSRPVDFSWVLRDQSSYGFQVFTQSPRNPSTFAVNWALCKTKKQSNWVLHGVAEDNSRPADEPPNCRFVRLMANISPICGGEGYWP